MNNLSNDIEIETYEPAYENDLIALWKECGLVVPQNNPKRDIDIKYDFQPHLLYLGFIDGKLVTSVMAGFEEHRVWINYLAVKPELQRQGIGRMMMEHAEGELAKIGCPKINLQVRTSNKAFISFYHKILYAIDDVVGMGKRLK
ncbi:GNAT family acetyltransferase [Chloroflexota bacterium]